MEAPSADGAWNEQTRIGTDDEENEGRLGAMQTTYELETLMRQRFEEHIHRAALCRTCHSVVRRSRVRSALRRAIQESLRHGIEPHEVAREFKIALRQGASR